MRVFTDEGLKKLENIEVGDMVLTDEGRLKEVEDIERISKDSVSVEVKRFHSCSLPEIQKIWVFDDKFDWKEAALLKEGMRMVIPNQEEVLSNVDHAFFGDLPKLESDYFMDNIRDKENVGGGQHKVLKVKEDETYVTTSGTFSSELEE